VTAVWDRVKVVMDHVTIIVQMHVCDRITAVNKDHVTAVRDHVTLVKKR